MWRSQGHHGQAKMCSETASLSMNLKQSFEPLQENKQSLILLSTGSNLSTHNDLHCPDTIISKYITLCEGDLEGPKHDALTLWPILLTLIYVPFLQVGDHDDSGWSFLPHKPPKIN